MAIQKITEEYYGHTVEISFTEIEPTDFKPEFIPDSVKEQIFELLEENILEGTFSRDRTSNMYHISDKEFVNARFSGSWRIIELSQQLLYKINLWKHNCNSGESLSEELFVETFGIVDGKHFYEKWRYTYKCDVMAMAHYFGKDEGLGQKFIDMLLKQVHNYLNRSNNG